MFKFINGLKFEKTQLNFLISIFLFFIFSLFLQVLSELLFSQLSIFSLFSRFILIPTSLVVMFFLAYENEFVNSPSKKLTNFIATKSFLLFCSFIFIFVFVSLKFLKLSSHNFEFFDTGFYLTRVITLSYLPFSDALLVSTTKGHFQPVLLGYSYIFKLFNSPMVLLIIQTLLVSSATIPAFLIAKTIYPKEIYAYILPLFVLLNPLTHFLDILGFVTDYLVLPLIIWAFFFNLNKQWILTLLTLVGISMCGEQWLPLVIGFSFFQIFSKQTALFGIANLILFSTLFMFLLFIWLPHFGSNSSGVALLGSKSAYSWLFETSILGAVTNLLHPRKIFFVFFVFGMFCFIPFLSKRIMLVAVPDLMKILLSDELLHFSVEGHYTAGIIGVSVVGLIHGLDKIRSNFGNLVIKKFLLVILLVSSSLIVAHSPSPISMNFYTSAAANAFNVSNYYSAERKKFFSDLSNKLINKNLHSVEVTNDSFSISLLKDISTIDIFPSNNWYEKDLLILKKGSKLTSGAHSEKLLYEQKFFEAETQIEHRFEKLIEDDYFISYVNIKHLP